MISENIELIKERMFLASQRAGVDFDNIKLMAVSKTRTAEEVQAAYKAGIKLFGENRVRESNAKFNLLDIEDAEVHLIGHLQKNKAKLVPGNFKCIQSIDSFATAEAISKHCVHSDLNMDILLEYNTSGEVSKSGYTSTDLFFSDVDKILELPNIRIKGLMTIAPFTSDQQSVRASFRMLKILFESLITKYPDLNIDTLSMGMSSDFETAIEEGSNLVRVGTSIFGVRG